MQTALKDMTELIISLQKDMESYPFDLGLGTNKSTPPSRHNLLLFSAPQKSNRENAVAFNFWMQHGWVWYWAFNHEAAIECFRKALEIENSSAMAHWGISMCNGPNYNTASMSREAFPSGKDAYEFAQKAAMLASDPAIRATLSQIELDLVSALPVRFNPIPLVDDGKPVDQNTSAFADEMRILYNKYPSSACIACMYAESLCNFSPWKLWNLDTGVPKGHTKEIKTVVETALVYAPEHPGLNHFMVHLMEMSPTPEEALPACAVLRRCAPDAGHLVHMPSHIYVLLGMWQEAVESNSEAKVVDDKYVVWAGADNCYTGYRLHDIHFIAYAAMFAGQYNTAMSAALAIQTTVPIKVLANPIMAQYFESFYSVDVHVLVRFGRWEEILSRVMPTNAQLWPMTIAVLRYARGISLAVLGNVDAAQQEYDAFVAAAAAIPSHYVLHNNTSQSILRVGERMLRGEILYRKGLFEEAFEALRTAVKLSDNLVYDEPWGWMQPPRHALGALLLEQGHLDEAEAQFRLDMDRAFYGRCHPDNFWALKGLAGCIKAKLHRLRQGQQHYSYGTAAAAAAEGIAVEKATGPCCARTSAAAAASTTSTTSTTFSTEESRLLLELAEVQEKLSTLFSKADVASDVACMCAIGR